MRQSSGGSAFCCLRLLSEALPAFLVAVRGCRCRTASRVPSTWPCPAVQPDPSIQWPDQEQNAQIQPENTTEASSPVHYLLPETHEEYNAGQTRTHLVRRPSTCRQERMRSRLQVRKTPRLRDDACGRAKQSRAASSYAPSIRSRRWWFRWLNASLKEYRETGIVPRVRSSTATALPVRSSVFSLADRVLDLPLYPGCVTTDELVTHKICADDSREGRSRDFGCGTCRSHRHRHGPRC